MIKKLNEILNKTNSILEEVSSDITYLKVYHGTYSEYVPKIKAEGLVDSANHYAAASWFMVATDLGSALYHARVQEKGDYAYVIEFIIPVKKDPKPYWFGYPYFWPGEKRNSKSTWFALMQYLPPEFIKEVHKIPYSRYEKQKHKGF